MRSNVSSLLSFLLFAGLAWQPTIAAPGSNLTPRTSSILTSPDAQPQLPSLSAVEAVAGAVPLNLDDIQGDILIGMKKNKEQFMFFSINDAISFKQGLKSLAPQITSTSQLLDVSKQPRTMINIAFSQTGLIALNVVDFLGDPAFAFGMFADADFLGDPGTNNWVSAFAGTSIHGVFLLASDSTDLIDTEIATIKRLFGSSITEQHSLMGQARPGDQLGHEHFGFMNGISQPAINGFTINPTPGQTVIDPGHILLGETGDSTRRPSWAKDGSFLVFRQLKQFVPEFEKFLTDNPINEPGLTPAQGSDLFGARLMGRWKSGAPVDLAPLFDDPVLAKDPQRNNNFNFSHPDSDITSDQTRCPFSAHIRKTTPRANINPINVNNHIIRAGIPFGPEVSAAEAANNITQTERGLAFIAYQSDITNGFRFQQALANNPSSVFGKIDPGWDAVIGQNAGQARFISGLDPTNTTKVFPLVMDFVQSRGGEYFFSPSISALKITFST